MTTKSRTTIQITLCYCKPSETELEADTGYVSEDMINTRVTYACVGSFSQQNPNVRLFHDTFSDDEYNYLHIYWSLDTTADDIADPNRLVNSFTHQCVDEFNRHNGNLDFEIVSLAIKNDPIIPMPKIRLAA